MKLTINISNKAARRLKHGAAAHGKHLAAYASQIIEEFAAKVTLDELLEPLREEFESSGANEEELVEQICTAQRAFRNTHRQKAK
jgi:hypothetical protein